MELLNKLIWSIAISLIIINSIYYSIKLRYPQFMLINKNTFKKNNLYISPKDTLIMTLSSKIGVGSLSGMAIAIYYGGLGTILWMWISTLFLSVITYIENGLAIIYKEKKDKNSKSGPQYYIKKGLNKKTLSKIYSILIVITYSVLFTSIQNNTITTLSSNITGLNKYIISLIITILSIIGIIKGIKTISNICNKIFPLMMIIYILIGLFITLSNINMIPSLLKIIIISAFSNNSIKGGIIYTILISIQKTIFANEAGVGTSAIISGTTDNNDYKLQAKLGSIQTYFINFIILTITSIIIGLTNIKNINISNGIELTQYAFNYHLGQNGEIILLVILFLFSFSTIITTYYYGESNLEFLTSNKRAIKILKRITIISIFIGGIINSTKIWLYIDIAIGILTIINMYAIAKLKDIIISKLSKK